MSVTGQSSSATTPPRSARNVPGWQSATVIAILQEAPDAVTLRLSLAEVARFRAGQYYNVRIPIPGRPRPIQRAYSIGSSPVPASNVIDIGVKETPGGLISPILVNGLSVGDSIEVRGPYGRFVWDEEVDRPTLLVGAGSGMVPLMSMIRYAAATGHDSAVRLVCSASDFNHAFYAEELALLDRRHHWLSVTHCITRDPGESRAAHHRRIDAGILESVVRPAAVERAYICGPPAMVEDASGSLAALGLGPEAILTEKFN